MEGIDFQTALGRLLRDARLRNQFASDPTSVACQLQVRECERLQFCVLSAEEIETQAMILLGKRFEAIKHILPATMENLGINAWSIFLDHARSIWPEGPSMELSDARGFSSHLAETHPHSLCQMEMNRLRFHFGRRPLAVHYIRKFKLQGRARPGLQVLIRRAKGWSEHALYCALS